VKLITQYYDAKISCDEPGRSKIQVYTDSASMIKKLKAYDKYPTAKLGTVLDSEWDVLSALLLMRMLAVADAAVAISC
jgi:hypothetical protein